MNEVNEYAANRSRITDQIAAGESDALGYMVVEVLRHSRVMAFLLDDALTTLGHLALLTDNYDLTTTGDNLVKEGD